MLRSAISYSLLLTLACNSRAHGAETGTTTPDRDWTFNLGGAWLSYPVFPGADSQRNRGVPSIEIHYRDLFFFTVADGLGVNVLRLGGWKAGPVANFAFPRKESDDRTALRGLGDVAFTLEAGAFVRYDFGPYATVKLEVRRGINGHDGVIVDGSLDIHAPPLAGMRVFISGGPHVVRYNGRYSQAYFGITPEQSQRSDYAAYSPDSGSKVGIEASAVVLLTRRVTLTAFGDFGRLSGDVASSPLTRGVHGSRDQATIGAALTYRLEH